MFNFGKPKKEEIDNSFDLDGDLDFEDFDFPDPFAPDDRKPGIKLATGLVKGAVTGVKNTAFLKKSLQDILPRGYGQTMDLGSKVTESARSLYDESAKEIKPAIKEFKKTAVKLIPPESKLVPKSVAAMLKRWGEEKDYDSQVLSKEAQQAAMLSQQMGEIFKMEAEQGTKQRAEDEGTRQLKEGIDLTRHRDLFGLTNRIALATERAEQYQSNVGLRYQKKALELQFRQLFATQDLLGHLQADAVKRDAGLLQIAKNTALPDYVKITGGENFGQVAKNKFMGKMSDGLFGGRNDMVEKTLRNVKDLAVGKVKGIVSGVRMGLSGAEQGADMTSGAPGVDKYTMAGNAVGSGVAQHYVAKLAGKARDGLAGSWIDKKFGILDKGKKLEVLHENADAKLNDFKDSSQWTWEDGFKAFLMRQLQEVVPNMRPDAQLDVSTEKDMNAPYSMTRRMDKSINEIIPGYLSRILREIQIFRTGNAGVELTEFNFDNSTFTSKGKLDAQTFKKIITPQGVKRTQENLDEMLAQIDPEGKLSPKAKDELKRKLLNNAADKKEGSAKNLGLYAGYGDVKESLKDEIVPLVRAFFEELDKDDDKKLAFSRKHNRVADDVVDTRAQIQHQMSLGRNEVMRKANLLGDDGRSINMQGVLEHHLKASKGNKAMGAAGPSEDPAPFMGPPRPMPSVFPGGGLQANLKRIGQKASEVGLQATNAAGALAQVDKVKDTVMDLYVQGEASPRIQATKLQLGHYKDAVTGLALFKTDDIAGDVHDELGAVVLAGSELGKLAYKDLKRGALVRWEGAAKAVQAFKDRQYASIKKMDLGGRLQSGLGIISELASKLKSKLLDVYVKGEAGPRMSAVKMQMGHYRSRQSGKLLIHQSDIDGPVEDELKNLVISAAEVSQLAVYNAASRLQEPLALGANAVLGKLGELHASVQGKSGLELLSLGYNGLKDKVQAAAAACDVFVEGSEQPRLYAVKLQEGAYRLLESGKAIYHQDEITGAVQDEAGNVVVSEDEVAHLKRFDVASKRFVGLRAIGRGLLGLARMTGKLYNKVLIPWTKWNLRMLGKAAAGTANALAVGLGLKKGAPKDVYVGSEAEPRLYGARIKAGHYRHKRNNRTIFHHDEISGEIVDGDNQVVLSDEDLDHMKVYDSMLGLPVKLVGAVIKGLGKGLATGALWFQKKAFGASMWMLGKLGSVVKKAVRFKAKPTDVIVKGNKKPSLYGKLMAAGRYFSALTKKAIAHAGDIDGDILDEDGQTVLSEEDIAKGLIDAQGNPLKGGLIGKVLGKLGKAFSYRTSLKGMRRGGAAPSTDKEKAAAKEASTGSRTVTLLEEIKTIFTDKFAPKKKLGDTDGDGDRDGSFQDKLGRRKAKAEAAKAAAGKGAAGKAAAAAAAAESGGLGVLDALGAASDAKDLLGGKGKDGQAPDAPGKTSKLGKLGKFAKVGGKALGVAGAAYGAYSAYDNIKQGNYGEAALDGAGSAAGLALTGALGAGVAASAGTAAMALGGGLLAFLASPVVLGAGAVALAGYGLYKGAQYLNRSSLTAMERIRYVQYGFMLSKPEHAAKVLGLEAYLQEFVKAGDGDIALDESKADLKKILAPFGFDTKDEKGMAQFFGWYQLRFKPVFFTHLTAIRGLKGKADLSLANGLKDEEKKQYIDAARFAEGPYHYAVLPLLEKDFNASSAKDVQAVVEDALKELSGTKAKAGEDKKGAAGAVTGAAALVTVGANGVASVAPLSAGALKDTQSKLPGLLMTTVSTVSSSTMAGTGRLNAVDAVRFKAYGLVELDADKVKSLQLLEKAVARGVRFDANAVATWQGNPLPVLEGVMGSFGVAETLGNDANNWLVWYKKRFLPIYMAYLSAYKVYTGKEEASAGTGLLKPNQQLELAKIIAGIKGVWGEGVSPWPNYKLSADSELTKANIALLEDVAKQAKLEEDKRTSAPKSAPSTTPNAALKAPAAGSFDTKAMAAYETKSSSPDAEAPSKSSGGGAPASVGASAGSVAMAGGELADGRNAMSFINMGSGVSFKGMNPSFMTNFYGMAEEYGTLTGKKIGVNDGFRTYEEQVAMKKKYGPRAAEPGNSLHEFGLAMDINQVNLDEMDKLGLMKKYGFTRPVGGEPWHMEPAGIQGDPSSFKKKLNAAIEAIDAGVGRGGGGFGTVPNAIKYKRNRDLAMKLLGLPATPNVTAKKDSASVTGAQAPKAPSGLTGAMVTPGAAQGASGPSSNPNLAKASPAGAGATLDAEAPPKPSASPSNLEAKNSTLPADPTVKIPDAKGSGYEGMKDMITACARTVGCDPVILLKTAAIESGFKSGAAAGTSSAKGLFQFTKDTWRAMLAKYGRRYGYGSETSPMDAKANTLMAAHYIKETNKVLTSKTRRPIGATETYIGHFMGPYGGATFLNALDKTPNANAAEVMPKAAASNRSIFYDNGRARTVSEVYTLLDNKMNNTAKAHGMPSGPVTASAAAPAPSAAGAEAGKAPGLPNQTGDVKAVQASYVAPSKAKPTLASAATDMSESPLSSAYGFKPMQAVNAEKPAVQPSQMGKELFASTEGLLTQSVDVQKKMLEVLSNIFGIVSQKAPASKEAAPTTPKAQPIAPYVVPNAPVSMRRATT